MHQWYRINYICKTDSEETYAIYEDNGRNNKVEQTKKVFPQKLTPVTILVVDTISSVRSRKLLKVLLDSGSATTFINKRCLPRHCKPYEISSSRQVNTLAGTYTSTKVVNMRNHYLSLTKIEMSINRRHLYFSQRLASTMSFWVLISWQKQVLMSNTAQEAWNGSKISFPITQSSPSSR